MRARKALRDMPQIFTGVESPPRWRNPFRSCAAGFPARWIDSKIITSRSASLATLDHAVARDVMQMLGGVVRRPSKSPSAVGTFRRQEAARGHRRGGSGDVCRTQAEHDGFCSTHGTPAEQQIHAACDARAPAHSSSREVADYLAIRARLKLRLFRLRASSCFLACFRRRRPYVIEAAYPLQ